MLSPPMKRKRPPAKPSTPGSVRIIGGRWRGRRLPVPDVPGLRPTPDRVRETLFNWLMPVSEGARCLDLFAGSGALGLEAASRGAAEVVLLERDRSVAGLLRQHVDRLDAGGVVQVHCADALDWLRRTPVRHFDVVFLDPPYDTGLLVPAWDLLRAGGWLSPLAWVYTEWPLDRPAPLALPPWRSARAGQVACALYRVQSEPAA